MCFVILTINLFFHKYSLNCMALYFLSLLRIFFPRKYSLKCTALFLDIHVVFIDNFNFLKDNETFNSVIKGKRLHNLSSLQIHIILVDPSVLKSLSETFPKKTSVANKKESRHRKLKIQAKC